MFKQIEYYRPIKIYIDNYLKQEISKYEWIEKRIMSDLLRNFIWEVYNYVSIRSNIKKIKFDLDKFYNIEEMEEKLKEIMEIYEEIKNNPKMVENILLKANWNTSVITYEALKRIYKIEKFRSIIKYKNEKWGLISL